MFQAVEVVLVRTGGQVLGLQYLVVASVDVLVVHGSRAGLRLVGTIAGGVVDVRRGQTAALVGLELVVIVVSQTLAGVCNLVALRVIGEAAGTWRGLGGQLVGIVVGVGTGAGAGAGIAALLNL